MKNFLKKETLRGFLVMLIKLFFGFFTSLLFSRFLLNSIGDKYFGGFFLLVSIIGIFFIIRSSNEVAIQRFLGKSLTKKTEFSYDDVLKSSFLLNLLISIFFCLLIFFFYDYFTAKLDLPAIFFSSNNVFKISFVVILFSEFLKSPFQMDLIIRNKFLTVSIIEILFGIFKLILVLNLNFFVNVFESFSVFYAIIHLLIAIIFIIFSKSIAFTFPNKFPIIISQISVFSFWTLTSIVSSMGLFKAVPVIINSTYGVLLNTSHSLSDQIKGQLDSVSNVLIKIVNAEIYKTIDIKEMFISLCFYTKLLTIITCSIYIPILLNLNHLVTLWLGYIPKYLIIILQFVLIRGLLFHFITFFPSIFNNLGKLKSINLIESLIYITLGFVVYKFYVDSISPYSFYFLMIIAVLLMIITRLWIFHNLKLFSLKDFLVDVFFKGIIVIIISFSLGFLLKFFFKESLHFVIISFVFNFLLLIFISTIFFNSAEKSILKNVYNENIKKILSRK